jgi:phosphohistidine phosphatase
MSTLLVLRHAKSSWAQDGLPDHDRPLNARGLRDAPRMALHLAHAAPRPDRVLCSTALRARQTLDAVLEALPAPPPPVALEPELYLAPASRLLARLHTLPAGSPSVLLVGHNPGLEDLVRGLTAGRGDREAAARLDEGLKTATLAVLVFEAPWRELAPASARLAALVRPKDLAATS